MQLKEQGKDRNWKVVVALSAAGALGLGSVAVAAPPEGKGIDLRDKKESVAAKVNEKTPDHVTVTLDESGSADTAVSDESPVTPESPISETDTQESPLTPESPISETDTQESPLTPESPISETDTQDTVVSDPTASEDSPS